MSTVRYCSPTNSTLFSTCCGCAVCDDELVCPHCKQEIVPRSPRSRHEQALVAMYGREAVDKWRAKARTKYK